MPYPHTNTKSKITLLAGISGSILEWYDFLLYAYFAAILAPLFFPAKTPFLSLLMTLGVFAIGFLVRPIGAIVIGRWGDLYGRKQALIYTILIITIPTVLIGLLPTYASIGIAAPILLVLIRCIQGFAVSGEISSGAAFLIEHAHPNKRNYAGSLIMSSAFFGILVGAAVVAVLTELMPKEILQTWGWRLPFLLAGVFGVIGYFIRKNALESPEFSALKQVEHSPITMLFKQHWRALLRGICLTVVAAIGNYFLVGFFTTYLVSSKQLPLDKAMIVNVISMLVFVVLIPLYGAVADKIGTRKIFSLSAILITIAAFPIMWLLTQKSFLAALGAELLLVMTLAPASALILTMVAELFPTKMRNTGSALAYNMALALFGGTAPVIAITLTHITGSDLAPAGYLIVGALISIFAAFSLKDPHQT